MNWIVLRETAARVDVGNITTAIIIIIIVLDKLLPFRNIYIYIYHHHHQGRPSWPLPVQNLTSEIYESIFDIW
jgi:hypothetical protein